MEAIFHAKQAMRLEPYYPAWFLSQALYIAYDQTGRYEDALAVGKELLKRAHKGEGSLKKAHRRLALSYARLDRMEEAREHAAEFRKLDPDFSLERYRKSTSWMFKDQKWVDGVVDMMSKAGLSDNPPLELSEKPSIAVLPFVNMSNDPDQESVKVDGYIIQQE